MELSFRVEPSMAKSPWKVLKFVFAKIWKRLKSNRKHFNGLLECIKQGKLERNAGKVFNLGFGLQDFEFSCKNSPNPMVRFELAKNRRRYFSCVNIPTVIEDYVENDYYTGKNGEIVVSVMGTPLIIQFNCRGSPVSPMLLSPYPKSYLNYSPNNEVDHRAEEFIRWFRNQFLKLRSDASRGVVGPMCST